MDWHRLEDVSFVYKEMDRVKTVSRTVHKNLFVDRETIQRWIAWGQLYYSVSKECIFLLRKSGKYAHIYYVAASKKVLFSGLSDISMENEPVCIDYVTKDNTAGDLFEKAGFQHYSTLLHMSVLSREGEDQGLVYGEYAVKSDISELTMILNETMDAVDCDLPDELELEDYIRRKGVLIDRDKDTGRIVACVLFTRVGGRLHLNYWAKNPIFQDGSAREILHSYWEINGGAKRRTVFVRESNMIARHIYESEGMQYDGLKCIVYSNALGTF